MLTDSYCKGIIATTLVPNNQHVSVQKAWLGLTYLGLSQMKWAENINISQNVKFSPQGGWFKNVSKTSDVLLKIHRWISWKLNKGT